MSKETIFCALLAILSQDPTPGPDVHDPSLEQWRRQGELRAADEERYELAGNDLLEVHARLREMNLPVLEAARSNPELLWRLLTDPETPETTRLAVGLRCGEGFDPGLAARLARAQVELEREREVHEWGLRRHPLDNRIHLLGPVPHAGETRTVLNHPWKVPAERAGMPFTWEEYCAAPWPWRVSAALRALTNGLQSSMRGERARAWLEACLAMPQGTANDALAFVRATEIVRFESQPAVVARWRAIVVGGPGADEVARSLFRRLAEVHRMWDDAEGRAMLRVLVEDTLRRSPSAEARSQAAYCLPNLSRVRGREDKEPAEPAIGALLAACELAGDVRHDPWTRLYTFAFTVCEAVDDPPIVVDRLLRPNSPEAEASLAEFLAAVPQVRGKLLRRYDRETDTRLRGELERLAPAR